MSRSMLVISRQAPWAGPGAREALDLALAGAAFELPLALLFLDDGVFQLVNGQQPAALQQKNLQANLQALPMFGVEQLYACRSSLQQRGLDVPTSTLPVQWLAAEELSALLARFDHLVTI